MFSDATLHAMATWFRGLSWAPASESWHDRGIFVSLLWDLPFVPTRDDIDVGVYLAYECDAPGYYRGFDYFDNWSPVVKTANGWGWKSGVCPFRFRVPPDYEARAIKWILVYNYSSYLVAVFVQLLPAPDDWIVGGGSVEGEFRINVPFDIENKPTA